MKDLIKKLAENSELAKVVYGNDMDAAYKAANEAAPCTREAFETFRKEQKAKADALNKVARAAMADEELGKVVFGDDLKAAYAAAIKVADGYTEEEFEQTIAKIANTLADGYEPPDVELTENDLDRIHSEGYIIVPVVVAANANAVANVNAAMNANAAINANAVTTANANVVANVNAVANINTGVNSNDWAKK